MIRREGIFHLLRPGRLSVEVEYYRKLRSTYHGLILSASSISNKENSLVEFLVGLGRRTPFLIDPRSYPFAFNPKHLAGRSGRQLKSTWIHLLDSYGLSGQTLPLSPQVVSAQASHLAEKVVRYQLTCVQPQLTFFGTEYDYEPMALVPPYFLVASDDDPWLQANLRVITETKRVAGSRQVFAVLLLNRPLLTTPDKLAMVTRRYADLPVDGFLYWIPGFREHNATAREVFGLRQVISGLRGNSDRPVISMYGGYLSALLYHHGLNGFSHSFDGIEGRQLHPPQGGPPPTLYYVPPLHQRHEVLHVEDYLKRHQVETPDEFHQFMCDCTICRGVTKDGFDGFAIHYGMQVWNNGKFQGAPRARGLTALHYLLARYRELKAVESASLADLVVSLRTDAERYRDPLLVQTGGLSTSHLRIWAAGLEAQEWPTL